MLHRTVRDKDSVVIVSGKELGRVKKAKYLGDIGVQLKWHDQGIILCKRFGIWYDHAIGNLIVTP